MSKFPNIMQPSYSNKCGAYSLVAALEYLDCFSDKKSILINRLNPSNGTFTAESYSVESDQSLDQIADLFYNVTGMINKNNTTQHKYGPDASNSLVAMAYIADAYGLKTSIFISDEPTKGQLEKLYPQELKLANSLGIEIAIQNDCLATHKNEVLIPTIDAGAGQHHIVALDYQNHLFDPAKGQTNVDRTLTDSLTNWIGVGLRLEKIT